MGGEHGYYKSGEAPVTPPMGKLSRLTIPDVHSRIDVPSDHSSVIPSSSPSSAGLFLSPPVTPVSATPSRNDIFSEDLATPLTPNSSPSKTSKRLSIPEDNAIWNSEARRRRSGAFTWKFRSRSATPTATDGFRIDFSKLLGQGLTSFVYSAILPTSETVAAKIPFNDESRRILKREALVLGYLHSLPQSTEFIIPYYGTYSFDDSIALCLELCPQSMQDYISNVGGININLWRSWLNTLLSGADFLHGAGILHNDIKPQNILLTSSLHPYLSDFAVSTSYENDLPLPIDSNIGTTVYTAPELLIAEDVATTMASDIYSLGITMFVAAMGFEPFAWTSSVTQKIMLKRRGDIFAGTEVRLDSRIVDIINGMCKANPEERWDSKRIRKALEEL